ncbi:MAG: type II secretion system protein [Bacilli bacterium]|nr:type II secretion system protein [Bacilli bacterium]
MKKGFTLVELLAVIVLLGILAAITYPIVGDIISRANEQAYSDNVDTIRRAASDWVLSNSRLLPKNENESIIVYLGELKLNSDLDKNIKNPKTGNLLSNNTSVVITKIGQKYNFEVNIVDVDTTENDNAPLIVIEGDIIDYVEVNQDGIAYNIPSVLKVMTSNGSIITGGHISTQILQDDEEVSSVDTSKLGTYRIIYSVTYEGVTGNYDKLVIVRDTTRPELNVGENISCTLDSIPENLLEGVTVTDNSGETITPEVRSELQSLKGTYDVYYTATDSSGNSITKKKRVSIN